MRKLPIGIQSFEDIRKLLRIGVNFNSEKRTIDEWKVID